MTRSAYIEQVRRQIYGGFPSDDSTVTVALVNQWLDQGIAYAAKQNYIDSVKMDGVGYVNNSFYSQFKNIPVAQEEQFTFKLELPQIPVGIGQAEGINTLQFIDTDGNVSLPCIPLSENQVSYFERMRPIANKILYYSEGGFLFIKSTLLLDTYTAKVRMISGGNSADLNSTLNVPSDYLPAVTEFLKAQLGFERNQPQNVSVDGADVGNNKIN